MQKDSFHKTMLVFSKFLTLLNLLVWEIWCRFDNVVQL